MIFGEGIIGVLLLGLVLFCLLDVITSDPSRIRNLPKVAWMLLVLIPVGSIAWLIAGRPQDRAGTPRTKRDAGARLSGRLRIEPKQRRRVAPDDDPAFLAELTRSANEHEQMLGSWEDDLRRREEELRRARDEGDGAS